MAYTSVVISSGHAKFVQGALGCGYKEHDEANKIMVRVAEILKTMGVKVVTFEDTTSKNQATNLSTIVNFHNKQSRQLDVSIHFNSLNANSTGVEVLYHSGSAMKTLAHNMSLKISAALGIRNRGEKQRSELYFLRNTNKPAILIETCFISNPNDMKAYKANFEKLCVAIAEIIAGKTYVKPKAVKYRLYSGTFAEKAHAEAFKAKLLTLVKVAYVNKEGDRYRVSTGTFSDRQSAQNIINKIRSMTSLIMFMKEE